MPSSTLSLLQRTLAESDPEIAAAIRDETGRQQTGLELIASENFVSSAVLEAAGSVMTNKYAEGYPGKRYYGGCEFVDVAESLAIARAKALFGAEHANVQPHSGAQANMSVFLATLQPGDTILGMNLAHGGHLTHGHPLNFSGKFYKIVPYGVRKDDERLDYDELARLAGEHRPKMIIVGASAYPRMLDFARAGEVARQCGALLMVDMAHIAGLVAGGVHPSPVPHADFVTTTTHKTLRGPRAGMVLCRERFAKDLDKAVFPGVQGGPLMHIIAAKAVCFREAATPAFAEYQQAIARNAKRLAAGLSAAGFRLVSGGTDNHLVLVDVFSKGLTGKVAEAALGQAGITVNKNAIPFDQNPPMVASGIRLGTPAVTTRGMGEAEMDLIADLIARALAASADARALAGVKAEVEQLCRKFPLYPGTAGLTAAVEAVFADHGPLARAVEHFEPREGQRAMALQVADTLAHGGVLLAEAGTGTGKTLAYLVPAILSGHRVLISTGTKNLQEQIFFKDLPVLQDALGVKFTATYMKGRANYLCLHRYAQAPPHLTASLDPWVQTTQTGDRAEIEDLPEDSELWREIAATADTCLGSDCPQFQDCYVTRMRQRAAASDIVIVNHHLLCADAAVRKSSYGEVIPDCHYAVLDEAHQIEDVATQYFGIAVSNYRLDDLVRDASHLLNAGVIGDDDSELRRIIAHVDDHARAFFSEAADVAGGLARRSSSDDGRAKAAARDTRLRLGPDWFTDIADDGLALIGALDGLEGAMVLAGGRAETGSQANEDALAMARRAGELRDHIRFMMSASDSAYVYFIETRGHGVFLRAAPIDVSEIMQDQLFDRWKAAVLTSATLTVEGSFAYMRGRLGIARAAELAVPSEFDFARQTILYLPRRMPPPKSPDFADAAAREVLDILRRTEGRAFVLFTSYSVLNTVRSIVEPVLRYPLIVQGTAPRSALLREFRSRPNAVLLATASFWQGVDVVGEQLSCVIIDKLPFASPGDPITSARIEAITAEGGDAFAEYQVPLAILSMLQGLGRLIRHRTDRGVLAVLDPRLRTMGYGARFLNSFPPAPVTSDLSAIDRFFAVN